MKANGSPAPRFDFDGRRTYFRATLPAHPEYVALSAVRDAAHLRALGEPAEALRRLKAAWTSSPASAVLSSEMIRAYAEAGRMKRADGVLETFKAHGDENAVARVRDTLEKLRASRR